MSERVLAPRNRGFLFLDSHPTGCERQVADMWRACPDPASVPEGAGPVALIIGSSSGYGLAAALAGLRRAGIRGIMVSFEKAPTGRRTATAGWYRTAATARIARDAGRDLVFLNGDAFSDAMKDQVADLVERRFGGRLDHLIYSVAAPRRTDPDTGTTYASVLKPVGRANRTKTLLFDDQGVAEVREVETGPAEGDDVEQTVAVMGGADWERWIGRLAGRNLLGEGFTTAALSYIGSPLTAAIYRQGTIGAAKAHLEATARTLDERLGRTVGGRAVTSVNGAAVTQSSTAIPGIALYTGLLRGVLAEGMVPPVRQLAALWDQLTGTAPLSLDEEGRIRLDTWELTDEVQAAVAERWDAATTDTIDRLADLDWFRSEVRRLYGFSVPGVDYTAPVATDVPWPAP
ncbi:MULTISPECIES: enoyl-[acyl-carrier-protein] reductase FabV [unclassified Streptomyces]|uniref:enoyl-[acyl-carrier-protein] reductase FabV n=1 Tax=unclassified Streptomyces TaxID=2593676 RepID=UPI0001C1C501|nr:MULTISPECIES: enoyl-[acyl-carrier-protein] reductase FabV [unclassified Streptomyces]MYR65345.1 enoyl-[acyl-carrier-protein] reductase FabV [Streptomyces sp. SID4939]MYS00600.1 enoyl-[acyl-carrier-protein] reductase FabV [Streptomyces sp. SID4940]MYT67340.1 enoyl-[acyl-carrier-protein] reductase FabV [Streptomyces sp. SID8357]MYT87974.1 enoyl-[acyl-carrier-protein] reductase FabV [Streptomyces sp. SID8360]MYU32250.1 enoyl-[acyl-carrier-protein] reductase FabV [Streptomyces sp. SID8358]MYW4